MAGSVNQNIPVRSPVGAPAYAPVQGRARHPSACAPAAPTSNKTGRAHGTHAGPALLKRTCLLRLDVLPCCSRSLPSLRTAVDGADGRAGMLFHARARRIRAALGHRADRPTTAARPDAKRPVSTKHPVENHDLQTRRAQTLSRRRRWLRQAHGHAQLPACTERVERRRAE